MTDPAEIAKKLTPAQVKVIRVIGRYPHLYQYQNAGTLNAMFRKGLLTGTLLNDLGRAVLAALDAKEST